MIKKPNPAQLAFHEELKGILDKHQAACGEVDMVAVMAQVCGSTIAITMVYDGLSTAAAVDTIVGNAKLGIKNGLDLIESMNKGIN